MSAKYCARPLTRCLASSRARVGRTFTSSVPRKLSQDAAVAGKAAPAPHAPKWSGQTLLAVAVAAGALGWGFASFNQDSGLGGASLLPILGGPKTRFDGKIVSPQYASLPQMEYVSQVQQIILSTRTNMHFALLTRKSPPSQISFFFFFTFPTPERSLCKFKMG
jgi:hypothetical protein